MVPLGGCELKTYSSVFKFQVVLEALKAEGKGAEAQVAWAYGVHPVTLARWKRHFLEHRAKVFGGKEEVKAYEKKVAELERISGQKEVEIALLKNFLRES